MMSFQDKPMFDLFDLIRQWRKLKHTVVFTNGCFDILHPGHLHFLREARSLGDHLVVGINTDGSVARLKGPGRPVFDLTERMQILKSLRSVDLVVPFDEDTPLKLIERIRPDFLVKGGDYKVENIVGSKFVLSSGGMVKSLKFVEGYSTTEIINRIKNLRRK